jgi:hypothetical protein
MITAALSAQIGITILCLAEAWLEDIVIKLKNPALSNYPLLNKKEHERSAVYYFALVAFLTIITWEAVDHHIWLVISMMCLRRIFFTYGLKLIRPNKRLRDIEGDQYTDRMVRKVFGKRGGYWELLVLLAGVILINKFWLL